MNITFNMTWANSLIDDSCNLKGFPQPTADCFIRKYCPQLDAYYVQKGILVILIYLVGTWLSWWFFTYGYKHFDFIDNAEFKKLFGNWREFEVRQYYDSTICKTLAMGLLLFTVVVVYLNL